MTPRSPYALPPDTRLADALAANAALTAELARVRADLAALIRANAGMRPRPGWRAGP